MQKNEGIGQSNYIGRFEYHPLCQMHAHHEVDCAKTGSSLGGKGMISAHLEVRLDVSRFGVDQGIDLQLPRC